MKKTTLFTIFLFALCTSAYSQYFIVKVGGGYAWPGLQNGTGAITFQPGADPDPANSVIMPLYNYNSAAADSGHHYRSNVFSGYGQGGHFDFAVTYMINPYFGVEVDGAYLWGSNLQATQTYDDALLGPGANIITKTHAMGLSLNPSLVFRAAKPTAKIAPYARFGVALPVQGALYHTLNITAPNFALGALKSSEIDIKTMPTVSVGFQGCIGVSYTPVPLISIFAEVGGQYLFLKSKESTVTKYTLDFDGPLGHNDLLSNSNALHGGKPYDTYSTVTHFVDELNSNSNTTGYGKQRDASGAHDGQAGYVDESKPEDRLRQQANLGSVGFSIGIGFNLSKDIFKDPFGKNTKK